MTESPRSLNPPRYRAYLERFAGDGIRGWVFDANNKGPLLVNIYIDSFVVATILADEERDLPDGSTGARCGFSISFPPFLIDRRAHRIRIEVANATPSYILGERNLKMLPAEDGQEITSSNLIFFHRTTHPSRTPQAIVGRNGWLFLANDSNNSLDQHTGRYDVQPALIKAYVSAFSERKRLFDSLGINYIFYIAPSKELICRKWLPSDYVIDDANLPKNKIISAIRSTGVNVVDLSEKIMLAEQISSTYHRTDTHWNYHGSYAAYSAIVADLSRYIRLGSAVPAESFRRSIQSRWRGDLSNKEKLAMFDGTSKTFPLSKAAFLSNFFEEEIENWDCSHLSVKKISVESHLNISPTRETISYENDDKNLPRALVFRDSFSEKMNPMLARNFSFSSFLWTPDIHIPIIERERPNVVIQIMIDRFLVRNPMNKN